MKKLRGLLGTGAWLWMAIASAQVKDMPGGPEVNQLNLHTGVTVISQELAWLNWMIMIICAIIFVGVFGVMFYSIIMHRKSRGAVASKFHETTGIEVRSEESRAGKE